MPKRTSQLAQIGKRLIEISNLEKVRFPDDNLVKVEKYKVHVVLSQNPLLDGLVGQDDPVREGASSQNSPCECAAQLRHVRPEAIFECGAFQSNRSDDFALKTGS